ncbi:hypothetical protein E2320_014722 [Naja naja]|nr:hypothetical protein E2320_014722 [Naja naja]
MSHLCVVGIFYITCLATYMKPASSYSPQEAMINTLFFTIVPAMVQSSQKSHKALGTCMSHLCVVGIFYITCLATYMKPASSYSPQEAMINTLFFTIVPAMVNPFIYSLRNRDVLEALKKIFGKHNLH